MGDGAALGVADVVEGGAGGAGGEGAIFKSEAGEGVDAEVVGEGVAGGVWFPCPGGGGGDGAVGPAGGVFLFEAAGDAFVGEEVFAFFSGHGGEGGGAEGVAVGYEYFGYVEAYEFAFEVGGGAGAAELGGGKFAGAEVGVAEADVFAVGDDGGEVVVAVGGEYAGFDDGAGGEDAHDFAVDEAALVFGGLEAGGEDGAGAGVAFAGGGLAELFGDGDAVAFADEAGDVGFDGVVGHAGHGAKVFLGGFAGFFGGVVFAGEGDIEELGDEFGVVVKDFVEVAETVE